MNSDELTTHEELINSLKAVESSLIDLKTEVPAAVKAITLELNDYIHKYEHWVLSFKLPNSSQQTVDPTSNTETPNV